MTVIQDAQKFFKYFGNIVHCFWHIPIHRNVCFQFCAIHYATQAQHAKINFICHDLWKVIVRFQFLKRLLKTYLLLLD